MFQRFGSFQAQQGNNKALHPQSQNDRLEITVTASTVTSYSFCCPFMAAWSHSSSLCCFTSPSISCHKQYLYYSSCHHHQHLFCRLPDSQRSAQSFILHCVLRFLFFRGVKGFEYNRYATFSGCSYKALLPSCSQIPLCNRFVVKPAQLLHFM